MSNTLYKVDDSTGACLVATSTTTLLLNGKVTIGEFLDGNASAVALIAGTILAKQLPDGKIWIDPVELNGLMEEFKEGLDLAAAKLLSGNL